jgi:beta-glucanase (GH16 family)
LVLSCSSSAPIEAPTPADRGGAGSSDGSAAPIDVGEHDAGGAFDVAPRPDVRPATDASRETATPPSVSDAGRRETSAVASDAARAGWTLVWSDEFDVDGAPNPQDWGFERGFVRNEELQWYQPANATVQNGVLVIEARREQVANPNFQAGSTDWKRNRAFAAYTSSSMTTSSRHSFTYGRFEIRARIDTRLGSWPAFWSLGSGTPWPQSGEVDIMEYYMNNVLANVCKPMGNTCSWSSIRQPLTSLGGAAFTSAFHVWAMEWDATEINLFLDGDLVNHFLVADAVPAGQTNPYVGKPMYILVNQAIGGTAGGDPANTAFPVRYEIDYVRVYAKAP